MQDKFIVFKKVVLVLLLAIILRLSYVIYPPVMRDESIYSLGACKILHGQILYKEVGEERGPLLFIFYALIFKLFGMYNMLAINIAGLICSLLILLLLFRIGMCFWDSKIGVYIGLFYAIFSFYPDLMNRANTEMLMLLPMVCSVFYFLRAEEKSCLSLYFMSGLMCGISMLFKQTGGATFLAIVIYFIILFVFKNKSKLKLVKNFTIVFAGMLLPILVSIIYFALHHCLNDYIFWSIKLGRIYFTTFGFLGRIRAFWAMWIRLLIPNMMFWIFAIFAVLSSVTQIYAKLKFKNNLNIRDKACLLAVIWAFTSVLAASITGRPYPHYYALVIPPFCILAGVGFLLFLTKYINAFKAKTVRLVAISLLVYGFIGPVVTVHGVDIYNRYLFAVKQRSSYKPVLKEVVRYLNLPKFQENSLLVLDSNPELYIFAHQKCPTRFISLVFAWGTSPSVYSIEKVVVPGFFDKFMEDLRKNRPKFIVDSSMFLKTYRWILPTEHFDRIYEFVSNNYTLEKEIKEISIYRLNNSIN